MNAALPQAMWRTVAGDGFPPCDGHTTFIGINSAGYACCFNAMRGGLCVMETAEGNYRQMSDLRDWRLLDRPAHGASRPAAPLEETLRRAAGVVLPDAPFTAKAKGVIAGDGKTCPNDHDPSCGWPECNCRNAGVKEGTNG